MKRKEKKHDLQKKYFATTRKYKKDFFFVVVHLYFVKGTTALSGSRRNNLSIYEPFHEICAFVYMETRTFNDAHTTEAIKTSQKEYYSDIKIFFF